MKNLVPILLNPSLKHSYEKPGSNSVGFSLKHSYEKPSSNSVESFSIFI